MDFTLAHLDKTSDANSPDFKKWLESMTIKNNGDDNLPMLSSEVKQIWRDRLDLEYENDRNFTKKILTKSGKEKLIINIWVGTSFSITDKTDLRK